MRIVTRSQETFTVALRSFTHTFGEALMEEPTRRATSLFGAFSRMPVLYAARTLSYVRRFDKDLKWLKWR